MKYINLLNSKVLNRENRKIGKIIRIDDDHHPVTKKKAQYLIISVRRLLKGDVKIKVPIEKVVSFRDEVTIIDLGYQEYLELVATADKLAQLKELQNRTKDAKHARTYNARYSK